MFPFSKPRSYATLKIHDVIPLEELVSMVGHANPLSDFDKDFERMDRPDGQDARVLPTYVLAVEAIIGGKLKAILRDGSYYVKNEDVYDFLVWAKNKRCIVPKKLLKAFTPNIKPDLVPDGTDKAKPQRKRSTKANPADVVTRYNTLKRESHTHKQAVTKVCTEYGISERTLTNYRRKVQQNS